MNIELKRPARKAPGRVVHRRARPEHVTDEQYMAAAAATHTD